MLIIGGLCYNYKVISYIITYIRGNFMVWFQKGGIIMYFITFSSVIALTVFIERLFQFYFVRARTVNFVSNICALLRQGRRIEAVNISRTTDGPFADALNSGILEGDHPKGEIEDAIVAAGSKEVPELEKNVSALATIAHITPLLGLLGTVLGMVTAFKDIEQVAGAVDPAVLAGGIWTALVTTVAGLSVAIPTYVAYNFLVSRVRRIVLEMEHNSSELVNILSKKKSATRRELHEIQAAY